MLNFESVIGLEVHAQLKTRTKTFCGCSTQFGAAPNTNVCPVCLGLPGALPVLNKKVVEMAIMAGLAFHSQIQPVSVFARKNYFYPDLPKGYQISQYELPICTGGYMDIQTSEGTKRIGIKRVHIEEDAGKLVHQGADAIAGATSSLVDLNRACTPLIEIVSEPDLRSPEEARVYMETLREILVFIDICDGNMEEGSLRADANVSIRPKGAVPLGTRTEVKNLNSFRSVERAIKYEISRQTEVLKSGSKVIQQTRHYDDAAQKTQALREKEESHDYRYFPDPDLTPLRIHPEDIERIQKELPELPQIKRGRYQQSYGLGKFECDVILSDVNVMRYFETTAQKVEPVSVKELAKWIIGDLNALTKEARQSFSSIKVTPDHLIQLVTLIQSGKISGKIGKEVLSEVFKSGEDPERIIQRSGAVQISDTGALREIVDHIVMAHPEVIAKVKRGKTQSADFLIGQVMKKTKGMAKPDLARQMILEKIASL